jgi:hypothetical protein
MQQNDCTILYIIQLQSLLSSLTELGGAALRLGQISQHENKAASHTLQGNNLHTIAHWQFDSCLFFLTILLFVKNVLVPKTAYLIPQANATPISKLHAKTYEAATPETPFDTTHNTRLVLRATQHVCPAPQSSRHPQRQFDPNS